MSIFAIVVLAGLVLLAILFGGSMIGTFNKLVTLKNRYQNGFAQIEVQLKRRYDLIPNMVEVAKGYMKHERETPRGGDSGSGTWRPAACRKPPRIRAMQHAIQGLASAEGVLTGTLGRLFALAESYPDLKANQNMMQVSEELRSTENKVAFARQAFNDTVTLYNTYKQRFPAVMNRRDVRSRQGRDAARVRQRGDRRSAKRVGSSSQGVPRGPMATDFFQRQDTARRSTVRLVILFGLAVLAIMASIEVLLAGAMGYLGRDPETSEVDWTGCRRPPGS